MGKTRTEIYLSAKHITAVRGRFNKKSGKTEIIQKIIEPIPDNTVLNGLIMDEDILLAALQKVSNALGGMKAAALVIDTTHIIFKIAVLPKASKKEIKSMLRNEFAGRDMANKDYIYDYSVLTSKNVSKKQQLVMCSAIDKSIIDAYKALFNRINGVKLTKIDFAQNTLLQALSIGTDIFDGENKLICVIDHYIISIMNLLGNGDIYFHRARILSTENDENYFNEVNAIIYSYMQGRKSVNRDEKTEAIYVFDGNLYSPENYKESLQRMKFKTIGIGIGTLLGLDGVSEQEADKYLYNICLLNPRSIKELNFLDYKPERKIDAFIVKGVIAGTLVAFAIGAETAFLYNTYMDIRDMEREIGVINTYLTSPEVVNAEAEYNRLSAESQLLSAASEKLDEYSGLAAGTRILTRTSVLKTFKTLDTGVIISNIYFSEKDGGIVRFDCYFPGAENVSSNVNQLRLAEIYDNIYYEGYDSKEGIYNFIIFGGVKETKSVE